MALVEIVQGSEVLSGILNDNFSYLDRRIDTFNESITTINTNIASVSTTINNKIDGLDYASPQDLESAVEDLEGDIGELETKINNNPFAPDYSNATTVSYSSGDAVGFDGWLAIDGSVSGLALTGWVAINGIKFCTNYRGNQDGGGATFAGITMVRATDVITMQYFSGTIYKIPFVGGNA